MNAVGCMACEYTRVIRQRDEAVALLRRRGCERTVNKEGCAFSEAAYRKMGGDGAFLYCKTCKFLAEIDAHLAGETPPKSYDDTEARIFREGNR